jgi:hypothetical protein
MMGVDGVQTKGQSKNYSFRYAIAWSWYAAVAKGPVRMIYFIYTSPGANCWKSISSGLGMPDAADEVNPFARATDLAA